jgi:hypothetical protein
MKIDAGIALFILLLPLSAFPSQPSHLLNGATGCDESLLPASTDPYYYLKGLTAPPLDLLSRRYQSIANLKYGKSASIPEFHSLENQSGIFFAAFKMKHSVMDSGHRLLFAGDVAIEEVLGAAHEVGTEYRFAPQSSEITAVQPTGLRMIEALPSDTVTLFRSLSSEERLAWEDQDLDYLSRYGERDGWLVHFSVGRPFDAHELTGSDLIKISIPKSKLMDWVKNGGARVGQLNLPTDWNHYRKGYSVEVALDISVWKDLTQLISSSPDHAQDEAATQARISERQRERNEVMRKQEVEAEKSRIELELARKKQVEELAELERGLKDMQFPSLEFAKKESGLSVSQLELIARNSKGAFSIEDYLRSLDFSDGYLIDYDPYNRREREQKDALKTHLEKFRDVSYSGLENYPKLMADHLDSITSSNKPIVLMVPKIFSEDDQWDGSKIALKWFLENPSRMNNVYFVFGGSGLFGDRLEDLICKYYGNGDRVKIKMNAIIALLGESTTGQ